MSLKEDLIAAGVRVKPLEWRGQDSWGWWMADTTFAGRWYLINRDPEPGEKPIALRSEWMSGTERRFDNFEEAGVFCQSHFEACILAALLPPDEQTEGWARDARQQRVAEWCAAAFGAEHQSSVPQRGLRFLEEAIEAYQALGGDQAVAHKLIDYIFAKEPGELSQELGGVGVTLLALAAAAKLSADDAERTEIARVLAKPLEHFWARNKVKNDAGFDATAYPAAPRSTKGAGE